MLADLGVTSKLHQAKLISELGKFHDSQGGESSPATSNNQTTKQSAEIDSGRSEDTRLPEKVIFLLFER